MGTEDPLHDDQFTAYVFGTLDASAHAEFERRLTADANLRRQVERLRACVEPLEAWETPEPPPALAERIVERVCSQTPLSYLAQSAALTPEPVGPAPRRSIVSLPEFIAIAASIAILFATFVPGVSRGRSQRLQARCAVNLASMYQGLSLYTQDYDGHLPHVASHRNVNWLQRKNRQHLAPALRLRFIFRRSMFCPSTPDATESGDLESQDVEAWLNRVNIRFYSSQNMNGPVPNLTARISMPLMADVNPVFEHGIVEPNATGTTNSRAHGGRGQNVLISDGSTIFLDRPIFGQSADNIWQAEHISRYEGTETQQSATDAFLIP